MKRVLKIIKKLPLFLTVCLMLLEPSAVLADTDTGAVWPSGPDVIAETAILMDADTGTILYQKNMDQVMYPASITKIMTCLLALENGNLSDEVTMTQTGVAYAESGSSNLQTQVGEVFTLEQLLYGTMLKSANDMATQVGEYIGGSIENFTAMMNEKAASLGCKNTHFNNACGMPDPDHYTSAYDMALICQEALKNPEFVTIIGTHSYTIPATNMTSGAREFSNHNPLLTNPDYAYPGIIGGKTGYTDAAQNTLATMASQNGLTLIAVTFKNQEAGDAANDHINLYNWGFSAFTKLQIEDATYLDEGGVALVPAGTAASAVTVTSTADDAGNVTSVYTYGTTTVGSSYATSSKIEAREEAEKAASAADESEKAASEESSSLKPDTSGSKKPVSPLVVILVIIISLIVAILVLMIVSSVIGNIRRKRRRRLRQQRREAIRRRRQRQEAADRNRKYDTD